MTQDCWKRLKITFSDWVNMVYKKSERNHHHYCKITVSIWIIMHVISIIFRIFWYSKNKVSKILYPWLQVTQNWRKTPEMKFSEWVDIFQKKSGIKIFIFRIVRVLKKKFFAKKNCLELDMRYPFNPLAPTGQICPSNLGYHYLNVKLRLVMFQVSKTI